MNRKNTLLSYFEKYKTTYIIIASLFLIGVIIGVIYINMAGEEKVQKLIEYVNNLLKNLKNKNYGQNQNFFIKSIIQNWKSISIIWLLGCTAIGSFLVYFLLIYRGFKIGYTIATIIYVLGNKKGIIFSIASLLFQNVIFIPTLFLISESSIKMCKQFYKNRSNIKRELIRHFIILIVCLIFCIVSSFLEVYVSTNFLKFFREIF